MIELAMHDAGRRSWKHLADERIEGEAVLPLGSRFWPISKDERHAVHELFKQKDVRHLVTKLRGSGEPARNRVKDAVPSGDFASPLCFRWAKAGIGASVSWI
jgi:hypothetical protein